MLNNYKHTRPQSRKTSESPTNDYLLDALDSVKATRRSDLSLIDFLRQDEMKSKMIFGENVRFSYVIGKKTCLRIINISEEYKCEQFHTEHWKKR
jgi:hypothetical protein